MDRGVSTLISILAAGSLTVAGCSAAGGQAQNGQSEQPLQTGIGQSGAKDGRDAPVAGRDGLPPGVLPPREPAQPGDARLGPDGHYDYAASDFVLTNPCDDPEIMAKLEKLGLRKTSLASSKIDRPQQRGCVIRDAANSPLAIWYQSLNHIEMRMFGTSPVAHQDDQLSWVTSHQNAPTGENGCVATIETPKGSVGFVTDTTGLTIDDFHNEGCSRVNTIISAYLQGEI